MAGGLGPAITFAVFSTFIVYTTWAALQGNHYFVDPYLSPFYSPVLFVEPNALAHGGAPSSMRGSARGRAGGRSFVPRCRRRSCILVFPGAFRFTCYYYRKAYYRSFAGSPPGCAVGPLAGKRKYRGETALLLFQNLHRYAMYFALVFIDPARQRRGRGRSSSDGQLGIGVGSIILTINVVADRELHVRLPLVPPPRSAAARTACRDCGKPTRRSYGVVEAASWFNARHMQFAWVSLIWVMVTDLYVRLVSMGVIHDFNTW